MPTLYSHLSFRCPKVREPLIRKSPMTDRLTVKSNTTLIPFLIAQLQGWSRSTIKQRLKNGCVNVNGEQVTRHDHDLRAGDLVFVEAPTRGVSSARPQLGLLYEDRDLIAINKPAGLLSVGSGKDKEPHALGILRDQLSRRNKSIKLWPVHRIDRDTSGVLLFATSREMREAVMKGWDAAEKAYFAIVEGCPRPAGGTIDQPLRLDTERLAREWACTPCGLISPNREPISCWYLKLPHRRIFWRYCVNASRVLMLRYATLWAEALEVQIARTRFFSASAN
jgi:23S rRNA-/tRNA-specific pseudouridylate synthase